MMSSRPRMSRPTKMTEAKRSCPPAVVVGIGCRRGCGIDELSRLLAETLSFSGLEEASICAVASIEQKQDEDAIARLSERLSCDVVWLPETALRKVAHRISEITAAAKWVGVPSVAEASALAAADTLGAGCSRLVATKRKSPNATLALALVGDQV